MFVFLTAATGARIIPPHFGSGRFIGRGAQARFAIVKPGTIDAHKLGLLMQHFFNFVLGSVSRKIDESFVGIAPKLMSVNHQLRPCDGGFTFIFYKRFARRRPV